MRKREMTAFQLRDWSVFHLILEAHGWEDLEETERRLDRGELMKPEAMRSCWMGHLWLTARYHAPVNMISLQLADLQADEKVQGHFLYDGKPDRILEWIVSKAKGLVIRDFEQQVTCAQPHCEMILLEKSDLEIYEVRPEART